MEIKFSLFYLLSFLQFSLLTLFIFFCTLFYLLFYYEKPSETETPSKLQELLLKKSYFQFIFFIIGAFC